MQKPIGEKNISGSFYISSLIGFNTCQPKEPLGIAPLAACW